MDALEAIQKRNSAARLSGQVSPDQLNEILTAGFRAPDHALLRPWRVVVIQGASRDRLGALFAQARLTVKPGQSQESLQKLKSKPMRAPLVIVVAAHVVPHPKVPEIEQLLSAGAMAQTMLNAVHVLGLGGIWRTGEMAYDPVVTKGLGLADDDRIVGFLYVGEIEGRVKKVPAHNHDEFVTHW